MEYGKIACKETFVLHDIHIICLIQGHEIDDMPNVIVVYSIPE
jgi:hypothetical protein